MTLSSLSSPRTTSTLASVHAEEVHPEKRLTSGLEEEGDPDQLDAGEVVAGEGIYRQDGRVKGEGRQEEGGGPDHALDLHLLPSLHFSPVSAMSDIEELSTEERVAVVSLYILQAPPGEINDVVSGELNLVPSSSSSRIAQSSRSAATDVRHLLDDDALFQSLLPAALKKYNHSQYTAVDVPGHDYQVRSSLPLLLFLARPNLTRLPPLVRSQTIIAPAALLPVDPPKYFEPRSSQSFDFDHVKLVSPRHALLRLPRSSQAHLRPLVPLLCTIRLPHPSSLSLPSLKRPLPSCSSLHFPSTPRPPPDARLSSPYSSTIQPLLQSYIANHFITGTGSVFPTFVPGPPPPPPAAPALVVAEEEPVVAKVEEDPVVETALVATADEVIEVAKEVEEELKIVDDKEEVAEGKKVDDGTWDDEGEGGEMKGVEVPALAASPIEDEETAAPKVEEQEAATPAPAEAEPEVAEDTKMEEDVATPVEATPAPEAIPVVEDVLVGLNVEVVHGKYTIITSGYRYSPANFWFVPLQIRPRRVGID